MSDAFWTFAAGASPTVAAVISAVVAWRVKKAVQEVHLSVNSRLTELLELTARSEHARGRLEGEATLKPSPKKED